MTISYDRARTVFRELARAAVSFLSLSYIGVLLLQLLLYGSTLERIAMGGLAFQRIQFTIFFLEVSVPAKAFFSALLLLLWFIYSVCFVFAWIGPTRRFLDAIRSSRTENRLPMENALFSTAILSSLVLSGVWSIQFVQDLGGVPTGEISFQNPFVALISLSISPIIEEIFFRLLLVGVPVLAHLVWSRRQLLKMPILNLFSLLCYALVLPGRVRTELQIREIGTFDYVTVALSSLLFGITHILFGAGWEVGKVTTSFLAGSVFSMAYLKYGFHVPILLHWFFNVYWTSLSMVNRFSIVGIDAISTLLFLMHMVTGYFAWGSLVVSSLKRAKDRSESWKEISPD